MEEWKDIKGYEGKYQISNLGRVKSLLFINNKTIKEREKILKSQKHSAGYKIITLTKEGKQKIYLIHRLVAEAFINNPNNKNEINHIDGNKENNNMNNLEWCTQTENMLHASKNNLINYNTRKKGSENPRAIKVNMIDKHSNLVLKTFGSIIEAANYIGINKSSHIVNCCKGKLKSAYGYRWEYRR